LESKDKAISVICWLFTSRWSDISVSVTAIIRLPEPDQENVQLLHLRTKHLQLRRGLSLAETVTLLCDLLKHESKLMRYLSIDALMRLCIKERKYLFLSELNPSGTSFSNSLGLIILENLLLLSGRESDANVRQIIAKCLGTLLSLSLKFFDLDDCG
jgi:hypothetical protein